MASVERAMAKAAAALLPGLLPTPPRSAAVPCLIILPSSFASKQPKPGRADSVERWDAHKKTRSPASSCGSSSPGRASSGECWDTNKRIPYSCSSTSSSSSSSSIRGSSITSCEKLDSSKRPPSRASAAGRWDTQEKACSAQADAHSQTGEQEEQEIGDKHPRMDPGVFSAASFVASPEPSMLPMPAFFRSRGHGMMPVSAH
uniref:Uncharacterized protein n=1 Tax=Avena sativa TaxID=4498 RepID=A0ACD5X8M9_AVESA